MTTNIRFSLTASIGAVLISSVLLSQPASPPQSEEYLLLGSPNRGAGEPFVSVNPKDRNNIIVAAMATLNHLPTGESPITRGQPGMVEMRVKELSVPDGSRTDIAVTRDGGKTWTFGEDKIRKTLAKNRCSDSFAGAGPDGTLYVGCLAYMNLGAAGYEDGYSPQNGEPRNPGGGSAIAWSTDKGTTWSSPQYVHPLRSPQLYPPDVHPVFEQVSPLDRPYFAADPQTGTIYLSGTGSAYTVDPATVERPKVDPALPGKGYTGYPPPSVSRGRTFIRASHDQGRTWGMIYPIDSDEYPGGRGGFGAAHGRLVVTYSASKVPAAENAQCPCTVLGTSADDGKTFAYKVIPPLPASAPASGNPPAGAGRGGRGFGGMGGGAMLAVDPGKEGRYAIARQSGQRIVISLTEDGDKTWLPPVTAAEIPEGENFGHRAMKYSPRGDLGLMWKAVHADRSYDVWSSVSRDGGRTFKTVRVSHAVSPPLILGRGNFGFGDDLSSLDLDDAYLHVVWGDNRSGFLGTWYGRVPLSAY
ncbi:MAG: glycoside hydrolase [Acidobacteriia bacterium]|nr:glycoside hydrolase [Terriglobia bacterium]